MCSSAISIRMHDAVCIKDNNILMEHMLYFLRNICSTKESQGRPRVFPICIGPPAVPTA